MSDQELQNDAAPVAAEEAENDATPNVAEDETEESDAESAETLDVDALRKELEKARRQAARYRRERNELRAKLSDDPVAVAERKAAEAERRAKITEALAERGVPLALYKALRDLDAADDVTTAADTVAMHIKALSGAPKATYPQPPASKALSLDELIADAERTGNVREAIRLKAMKLMR